MKLLLIFSVVVTLVHGWVFRNTEIVQATRTICIAAAHISSDQLHQIEHYEYPNTTDAHSYVGCVLETLQIWDSRTGFQSEEIRKMLNGYEHCDEVIAEVEDCNKTCYSHDTEVWLFNGLACILNGPMGGEIKDIIDQTRKGHE